MPPTMKMFRKFFKRSTKSKDVRQDRVECDSVPTQNQANLPAPIAIPQESLTVFNEHPIAGPASTRPNHFHHLSPNNSTTEVSNYDSSLTTNSYHSASSHTYSGHSSATPYMQLSVSNSHSFHIGDVQNVHVSNGSVVNFNPSPSSSMSVNLEKPFSGLKTPVSDQATVLMQDYSKIKDWEISLISEYITQDWKNFGKHLEIQNNDLETIEKQSTTPNEAALGMLKLYLKTFPDTSYGFILHNLRETTQTKAFEQLLKTRS